MSKLPKDKHVLVIDDDEIILRSCQEILVRSGYEVETFNNGQDGINRFRKVRHPLVVIDLKMPEIDGIQVIQRVRTIDPNVIIVVITGYATVGTAVEAMQAGAYDFLPKPFTPDELRLIIGRGHERWCLARESQQLRREKEEIERRFVTFITHQLKSPLVAVKQYLDTLVFTSREQLPDTALEWISRAQVRTEEMLEIINQWLTLAKLERGVLCDGDASVALAGVIQQVVQSTSQQAESAGVTVQLDLPGDLPKVRGDVVSLSTLMANLLCNAIKYNRRGGSATIAVTHNEKMVTVEMRDTGIGIPEECLPRLFGEFYRVKTDASKEISGTGLGLAICKRIVSELGGSIDVSSQEGRGSTFVVQLPIAEEKPVNAGGKNK